MFSLPSCVIAHPPFVSSLRPLCQWTSRCPKAFQSSLFFFFFLLYPILGYNNKNNHNNNIMGLL